MSRKESRGKNAPRLSHEQAADLLVDYHFGRLPRQMNAAVEAHVKSCRICQKQGLEHAATEMRAAVKVRVKPSKPLISTRAKVIFFALAVLIGFQLVVFELIQPGSPLVALLRSSGPAPSGKPTATASATATPAPLAKALAYDPSSAGSPALAISPDGATLAVVQAPAASAPTVTLFATATGKPTTTLSWTGPNAPGTLAWSPDGKQLAAADGSEVGVWSVTSPSLLWLDQLPGGPAVRVYAASDGSPLQKPDATASFSGDSALSWSTSGQVSQASEPAGAGAVSGDAAPIVTLWQARGTHLFAASGGAVQVGYDATDVAAHRALLAWSPDGHHLLWASLAREVAVPPATTGLTAPNAAIAAVVAEVAHAGHGDALAWFAPDLSTVAACARTQAGAPLILYDAGSGRVLATLEDACEGLSAASVVWSADGKSLLIAAPHAAVTAYSLPTGG